MAGIEMLIKLILMINAYRTALMYDAHSDTKAIKIFDIFLDNFADPYIKDYKNYAVYDHAVAAGNEELVIHILESMGVIDGAGETYLL